MKLFYSRWYWEFTNLQAKVEQPHDISMAQANMFLVWIFQGTGSNFFLEERQWSCSRGLEGAELSLHYNLISYVKLYRYKTRKKRFKPAGLICLSKLSVLEFSSIGTDQPRQPVHVALNLPILPATGTTCSLRWGGPAAKLCPKTVLEIASCLDTHSRDCLNSEGNWVAKLGTM